jgi:hypothetical protein
MTPPIDPSEMPGTPEYEEVYEAQRAYIEMLLNSEDDELDNGEIQFPYRFGS